LKKVSKILFMDAETLKLKLDKLIDSIYELRESLDDHSTALPAEALQKLSRKVCLFCSKPIGKNEVVSRGCHDGCAQKIRRRIRERKTTDEEMVAKGLWCPPLPGGRPADPDNPFAVDPSFFWKTERSKDRPADEPLPDKPPRTANVGRKRKPAVPPAVQPQAKKGKATG
jgi:hypothetical protein